MGETKAKTCLWRSTYPSPYSAYPFVRSSGRAFSTPFIYSTTRDSAANARVLIIYLRDVRRTCRTFAIARASERARPLRHSGFRTFFVPAHCMPPRVPRDGGWPFSAIPSSRSTAMFINESQLQFRPDAHFYSGGKVTSRSSASPIAVPARVPWNSMKMLMSRIAHGTKIISICVDTFLRAWYSFHNDILSFVLSKHNTWKTVAELKMLALKC